MKLLQKQAEREHALSSMPGEMPFCKNKPEREHAFVKPEKTRKRTCFVKYAFVCKNMLAVSSMPGEMPFCKEKLKENMLCQVCLVKCRFAKHKPKENMLCRKYAW